MTRKVFSYFFRPGSLAGAVNFAGSLDRTHQEFKDECDINFIMSRYQATGVMPAPWKSPPAPSWGDFASAPDYLDAQNMLIQARDAFMALPSKIRSRFNHEPGNLLAFVSDKANLDEARTLGLVPPAPPVPPEKGTL